MQPKLKHVAERAGVSVQVASVVINGSRTTAAASPETRQRVLSVAKEMGYVSNALAASLVKGQSSTIGIVCFDLLEPILQQGVATAEAICAAHGHSLMISAAQHSPDWPRMLRDRRVDLLIALSANVLQTTGQTIPESLQRRVIVIGSQAWAVPSQRPVRQWQAALSWNDRQGGSIAAEHLIERGCRKLAVFAGSTWSPKVYGALQAAARRGVEVHTLETDHETDKTVAGAAMMRQLFKECPDADGIFFRNEGFYAGALHVWCSARPATPLPALVGYGATSPCLTSVQTPIRMCVEDALQTYFDNGPEALVDKEYPVSLRFAHDEDAD